MTTKKTYLEDGIYSPVTTYFQNDKRFSLDLKTQNEHALFLYRCGIAGIVVAGSMGECISLTKDERSALVKSIRTAIPDRSFKILMGVPSSSIADIIQESELASNSGADVLLVLVPGFFGPNLTSQDGLFSYFTSVANHSLLPILIYDYPGASNNITLTLRSFAMLSYHENIIGAKLTHSDMGLYTYVGNDSKINENGFKCFTGLGQLLLPAISVGISGAIDALSAIFPKTMVHLYQLCKDGKNEEAARLQYQVSKAELMVANLNVVGVKLALQDFHGIGECVTGRAPLNIEVDHEAYDKFKKDLETLQRIEKSL